MADQGLGGEIEPDVHAIVPTPPNFDATSSRRDLPDPGPPADARLPANSRQKPPHLRGTARDI